MYTETQKIKPDLVASYDIRPWNGEDLFWFRCFTNLFLTPTYLQPRTHTRLVVVVWAS